MNFTRYVWQEVFHCHVERVSVWPIILTSVILCCIPVVFYLVSKIFGQEVEPNVVPCKFLDSCSIWVFGHLHSSWLGIVPSCNFFFKLPRISNSVQDKNQWWWEAESWIAYTNLSWQGTYLKIEQNNLNLWATDTRHFNLWFLICTTNM